MKNIVISICVLAITFISGNCKRRARNTSITEGLETFLENMEVTPYIVNGKGEGLCITGLDDLNMSGNFGFENGDVIQTINGQMLTNKQQAFQVLKKAQSQSSLNFQLLRNQHKLDLSFEIKR